MKELMAFALLGCGVAVAAAYALSPSSVESLLVDLEDPDPAVRRAAVNALGRRGEAAKSAVPVLQEALNDKNFAVRVRAGVALTKLGITGGEVPISPFDAPALIDALEDRDTDVRDSAREGLEQVGGFALPALIQELDSDNESVRRSILSVLFSLGPDAAPATPALIQRLSDEASDGARTSVINVLGRIGPAAREAVPALIDIVKTGDRYDRRHAVNSLGGIGPAASQAIPLLEEALADKDTTVAINAKQALQKIRPSGEPVQPTKRRRYR